MLIIDVQLWINVTLPVSLQRLIRILCHPEGDMIPVKGFVYSIYLNYLYPV